MVSLFRQVLQMVPNWPKAVKQNPVWLSAASCDMLHVTRHGGSHGKKESIQVVPRQGRSASQALAPTRLAAYPDLGTRHALPCCCQKCSCQRGSGLYRCHLRPGRDVKRGEIRTVAGGKDYARKPRPVVILQDDRFDMTDSVTVCAFTTDPTDAPLFRLLIKPSENNGLRVECRLMADKVTTVPKTKIGACVGRLADEDMVRLNRAVLVFLGIAAPTGNEQLEPA